MIFHIEFQYEIEVIYAKEEIVFIVLDICNVPKQIETVTELRGRHAWWSNELPSNFTSIKVYNKAAPVQKTIFNVRWTVLE